MDLLFSLSEIGASWKGSGKFCRGDSVLLDVRCESDERNKQSCFVH